MESQRQGCDRVRVCAHTIFFSIWPVAGRNVVSKINLRFRMQVTNVAFVMRWREKKM